MKVEAFTPEHVAQMNKWYVARGLPPIKDNILPAIGLIVQDTAACFLYRTDSDMAILEGLVSNPEAPKDDRREAMDRILKELIAIAKDMGFTRIIGLTQSKGTLKKMSELTFDVVGMYAMVSKRI